jgi:hypothetical protein
MRRKNHGLHPRIIFIRIGLVMGLLLGMSLTWLLAGGTPEIKAQGGTDNKAVLTWLKKPQGKLSHRLELLAQPDFRRLDLQTQSQIMGVASTGPGSLLKNEAGEVLVYIRLTDTSAANLEALAKAGANIVHVAEAYRTVTAFMEVGQLTGVVELAFVESLLEVETPFTAADMVQAEAHVPSAPAKPSAQAGCGTATTEGDTLLNATAARAAYGLDGSGVTVGIISTSYNNASPSYNYSTTAAIDIASGDLPGPGNPCGRTTPVNVLKEGAASNDEGRAMLQVVHDLAPGAKLAFAPGFLGVFGFQDEIRALRYNAGADIIVDDIFIM